jgi:hypothetical protein
MLLPPAANEWPNGSITIELLRPAPINGRTHERGDTVDVPVELASRLKSLGVAKVIEIPPALRGDAIVRLYFFDELTAMIQERHT